MLSSQAATESASLKSVAQRLTRVGDAARAPSDSFISATHPLYRASPMPNGNESPGRLLRARAPLRVSFAGGGTDVPPYPAEQGGLVLSATINRYAYGTLRPREDRQIGIQSLDLDAVASIALEDVRPNGDQLDLIRAAVHKLASDSLPRLRPLPTQRRPAGLRPRLLLGGGRDPGRAPRPT